MGGPLNRCNGVMGHEWLQQRGRKQRRGNPGHSVTQLSTQVPLLGSIRAEPALVARLVSGYSDPRLNCADVGVPFKSADLPNTACTVSSSARYGRPLCNGQFLFAFPAGDHTHFPWLQHFSLLGLIAWPTTRPASPPPAAAPQRLLSSPHDAILGKTLLLVPSSLPISIYQTAHPARE